MKLSQIKNKLKDKKINNSRCVNKKYTASIPKKSLDSVKIIGITGSSGKSTTAFILHEYLKYLGYKSVLYSSVKIESPASYLSNKEGAEITVDSEATLLSIIEEVEAYGADYLVLEVNESTIEKGILDDISFDVKVLTNLNPSHNSEHYLPEKYVSLKKSFFANSDNNTKCVIGLQDYDQKLFNDILELNQCQKYTFTTEHIASVKHVNVNDITCLLYELFSTLEGLNLSIKIDNKSYNLNTNLMMKYNALNILGVITTLYALDMFEYDSFSKFIENIKVPGRAQYYKVKDRLIIIDAHLTKMLYELNYLKNEGLINKIKVVVGAIGSNFKTWNDKFKTDQHLRNRQHARKYAMDYIKKYADFVYITEQDNAAEDVIKICNELQSYLDDEIPSVIIKDREQAIQKALEESNKGDVIFISGRGNRKTLCVSEDKMKLFHDSDIVEKCLKKIKVNRREVK